jgi:hypothetical protein
MKNLITRSLFCLFIAPAILFLSASCGKVTGITSVGLPRQRALTGNSGKSIESYGIKQEVYGTWMSRSSWQDLHDGNWMWVAESGVPAWRTDHFDRAIDVGTPLIPTDAGTNYNDLLRQAISGAEDTTYVALGKNLAKYGSKTVFSRLWWEFNMYPVQQDSALFISAWRRAVPLIRQGFKSIAAPGQKLYIVWCSNAGAPNPEPYYPGDDVVDIIGSDTYGMVWGDTDPTLQQMLDRITKDPYMLAWQANFANKHKKPTCIGEFANVAQKGNKAQDSHGLGDCPQYIDTIYDWMKTCKYGCVYVCYFNLPDGGIQITLDQTPNALSRLKARAQKGGLDY